MVEEREIKYERCKAIQTVQRTFVNKLATEVDKIVLSESIIQEQHIRINVIYCLLKDKSAKLVELDKEALSLCEIGDIAIAVEESETIVTHIMEYKGKIKSVKGRNSHKVTPTTMTSTLLTIDGDTFKGDVTQ